ncbi:MAG TPA: hypothetical protein VET48_10270 [Steroidobacteraceae bacterium]|nr:hypothetical protein [Steroidobacteraceae bacterium]
MRHAISTEDREFLRRFTACEVDVTAFHHREHVELAYTLLVLFGLQGAVDRMRQLLHAFIRHHGIDVAKYHETITAAWLRGVLHFMEHSNPRTSAASFIDANPILLRPGIMLSHYSRELLFSERARKEFVEPDLEPIPLRAAMTA